MNIIIPLGGKGERFKSFTQPKPLIKIFDKCMISYVIDNLEYKPQDKFFIIYNKNLSTPFVELIKIYPFINLIEISDTRGAVETLSIGIDIIINKYDHHKKSLILDCDTFYTSSIINDFRNSDFNMVFYTKNFEQNPIYSYIILNETQEITIIKEKEKISDNANTGAYAFLDILQLNKYCKYVLENGKYINEPYTSYVINEMIKRNIIFKGHLLNEKNVYSLGTPQAVNNYKENVYAFLFDLDGTLVITDDIYFKVWYEILDKYNIVLTQEIFKKFIQGNNDKYVLNTLLVNIDIKLEFLSNLKDSLFIANIDKLKIINGVHNFLNTIKQAGHKLCIVTNSNKVVAEKIVHHIKIEKFVDFIISSNDCVNGKPDSEPYKRAIDRYNIENNKCFIFEDSKTGILSGKGVNPKLLIGIETIYDKAELLKYCNLTIKDYTTLNLDLIDYENKGISFLEIIKNNTQIKRIKEILIDNNKLKGGFIADVISFKIITENDTHYQILKYENKEINALSSMATQLDLYNREYYFYETISPYITINIPKYYNLINVNGITNGIVLENLISKGFIVNLDLNTTTIDTTLIIVDRMAKMHASFWNKDLKTMFPQLKSSTDVNFCPFFSNFIETRYDLFKSKWFKILNKNQINICEKLFSNFKNIQETFSNGNNLTFIHGDIKSPNIFYDQNNNNEPCFIDWQHCAIGKGVQDLIFFILESFDINVIKNVFNLTKYYYYKKLTEYNITNYTFQEYSLDIYNSICYIPFFTSVWFGTVPQEELIDKNFPYFLITKMFYLLEIM